MVEFINALFGISIGLGFSHFPKRPFRHYFPTIFFVVTLVITGSDWYYYTVITGPSEDYLAHFFQILMILGLSQMFRNIKTLKYWCGSFLFYLIFVIAWDLVAIENNYVFALAMLIQLIPILVINLRYKTLRKRFKSKMKVFVLVTIITTFLIYYAVLWVYNP